MTKTDADCFRLLPDRRLGSFHRLRDIDDRGPRFRMGFELPQILFEFMVCGQWVSFSACLPLLRLTDRYCIVAARVEPIHLRVVDFVVRYHIFRWTKGGFARSSTSTWTRFMRPLNSATIQVSKASRWRSAIRPNAASLLQRAMRRGVSEFARQCRQPSRFGSAPNSCLSRQGSTCTAKCPNRFMQSSRTTLRWLNRSPSMKPICRSRGHACCGRRSRFRRPRPGRRARCGRCATMLRRSLAHSSHAVL